MKAKILLCILTLHLAPPRVDAQAPEPAPTKPVPANPPPAPPNPPTAVTPPTAPGRAKLGTIAKIRYKPPVKDAPKARQDAGTRSPDDLEPALFVLTPNHVALTTQAQPSLFWYQSKATKIRFEFTLTEPGIPKPVLQFGFENPGKSGICRVKLSDRHVSLKPGVEYCWSVALVPEPLSPSRGRIASGKIRRVPVPKGLGEKLAGANLTERPSCYAESGIWYDALEALSDLVDANPQDPEPRLRRAELLEQGKLGEPADFEKQGIESKEGRRGPAKAKVRN